MISITVTMIKWLWEPFWWGSFAGGTGREAYPFCRDVGRKQAKLLREAIFRRTASGVPEHTGWLFSPNYVDGWVCVCLCVCVSVCVCVRVALAEPFERTDLRRRGRGRPAVSVRAGWAKNLSSALLLPVCWAPGLGCYPPFPRGWEKELRPRGPGGGERRPRGPPPYIQWPLSYFRWAPSLGAGDKLCLPESQGLQLFFFCLSEKGHQLSYTYLSYCICVLFAHILPLPPFPQSIRQLHCFLMNRLIQETAKIKKKNNSLNLMLVEDSLII